MASFFQSFRSSLMPKQLLRYALSRLDLLDAQALDLENLDFALGRNTVLEFRDVGLMLQKLERLLELPPAFTIQKAKVLVLRVTVPMDFYNSPITAEVDGVDVRLRVASKEEKDQEVNDLFEDLMQRRGWHNLPGNSIQQMRAYTIDQKQALLDQDKIDEKKRGKGKDGDEHVPSAAELAQSFLETQPTAEKQELEEALAAESQDLGASVAISEPDSDDGLAYGTGQALSLPAFLTDFLQGVVDRMQIRIRGINLQVDMKVPVDPAAPTPELVTFQLALENINVEGVTTPDEQAGGASKIEHKEGKRHILLDNIRAFLISEANVFSTMERSPSMVSSAVSYSPVVTAEAQGFSPSNSMTAPLEASVGSDLMANSEELAQSQYSLQQGQDVFDIPYDMESDSGEGQENEMYEPASSCSTPRASTYLDSTPPLIEEHAKSAIVGPDQAPWAGVEREAQSEPYLRRPENVLLFHTASPGASVHSAGSVSSGSEYAGSGQEDLTESHIYSHEEAESMYMSAFSQAESVRLRNAMPGAWDTDDVPEETRPSPRRSPTRSSPPSASQQLPGLDSQQIGSSSEGSPLQSPAERPETPRATTSPATGGIAESLLVGSSSREPEPQQDDTLTPRGPTRLVKEIMSLDSMSVYVPSARKHIQVVAPDLGKSSPNLPGAFSVHSSKSTTPDLRAIPVEQPPVEHPHDNSVEIILKPLEVRFDTSIGFLLATVVARLIEATTQGQKTGSASEQGGSSKSESESSKTPDIKFTAEEISIHFLEKLVGVADTPERVFRTGQTNFGPDVLLKMSITELTAALRNTGSQTEASLGIEKFKFGYANDDIVSFDRQVQMYESVANTFPSAGQDIFVKATMSSGNTRVEVNTLPLHMKLDLRRLDETFSWFGGLSGFLAMGSSVTSNTSKDEAALVTNKSIQKQLQKPRGVRFDAPIIPDDRTAIKENKTDLRVNGLRVDVIGKDCSVVLNTSALKLVNREEGIGVHFSRIRLAGPYLRNTRDAPVIVEVADTRLEYVMVPRNNHLERLLELITPSKVKFDENEDEIMVDTLLRQRRKGPVLGLTIGRVRIDAGRLQQLSCLPELVEDLAKLGNVAKYLPEDDRPGLLTLGQVKNVDVAVDVGGRFGIVQAALKDLELAHITIPSLVAVAVNSISVTRNRIEELVGTPAATSNAGLRPPVLMMRMVDDIEPVLKIKLMGLSVEYRVPTVMDILGLTEEATPQDFEHSLAASVANLGDHAHAAIKGHPGSPAEQETRSKPIKVDVALRDCLVGLNPLGLTSKLVLALTDAHLEATPGKRNTLDAVASLKKASVLLIDDVSILDSDEGTSSHRLPTGPSAQIVQMCSKGYVNICQISAAKATAKVSKGPDDDNARVEVEVRDDLLVIETCADSTQTLITLANALTPPTPPSKEIKYRTSVVPVQDLLASITADAFGKSEGDYDFDNDFAIAQELGGGDDSMSEQDYYGDSPLQLDSQYYEEGMVQEELFDATNRSLIGSTTVEETSDGILLSTASLGAASSNATSGDELRIEDDYFESRNPVQGTAHRWNSKKNTYDQTNDAKVSQSPLKVCVRDVHVIWHLFDGYDWTRTRDVISKAVQDVEAKAYEKRARAERRGAYEQDFDEEETAVGDFLFNSIYISVPGNRDPRELAQAINQELHDNATETESIATTAFTTSTARAAGHHRSRSKRLKLNRSKRHKITFELKGVNVDVVTFPPGEGETLNSIDVRIHDLDVFDHVPTSTWKKFAMYDHDAGERELGADMVHLELLNTKPVPSMPASEIVLRVSILPLRLHVDQDALDFITRFFEFKDEATPVHASPSDIPFIQRAEINDVPIKLDFKPKRVDYAGLRSGHTTEFMNFLILEDARLTLRHVILYGVSGFDKLGIQLNDIWTDNVKRTQLPGILAGLAPVRSLVNAGSGIRDLIEIPIREYRKDGRIVRSIGKGAAAFAKTTGTEVVKLGAKLAIGTQYALQGAEGLLNQGGTSMEGAGGGMASTPVNAAALHGGAGGAPGEDWGELMDDEDGYPEERKQISLYADQPLGIIQGMRGAYSSLARDLSIARDAIIAVPAEVMESGNAQGAAKAVLKRAPTIIFRPAIGATKAIGQTLLGATNALDPQHRRRMEAKYKKH